MSWAAERETSREEDTAYSLMGLFDIHMPLLYGEGGSRAFLRLQEEIWKRTEDYSLLLWAAQDEDDGDWICVLAPHPRHFRVPFQMPILPSSQDKWKDPDGCLPTEEVTMDSWDELIQVRNEFSRKMHRYGPQRPPDKRPEALSGARLVKYSESFPTITPGGLSAYFPVRRFGSQILAWPYTTLNGYSVCMRFWNNAPNLNDNLDNDDLPFTVSRRTGKNALWMAHRGALDLDFHLNNETCGRWILRNITLQARPTLPIWFAPPVLQLFKFVVDIKGGEDSLPSPSFGVSVLGWLPYDTTFSNHTDDAFFGLASHQENYWEPSHCGKIKAGILLRISGSKSMQPPAATSTPEEVGEMLWVVVAAREHSPNWRQYFTGAKRWAYCSARSISEPCPSQPWTIGEAMGDIYCEQECDHTDRGFMTVGDKALRVNISAATQYSRRKPMDQLSMAILVERAPVEKAAGD